MEKADITRIPKPKPVCDVNKHLRPISLTAIVSKVAEEFVVENYVKPVARDEPSGNRNLIIHINAQHNVRIIIAITKRNFHKFNIYRPNVSSCT
jgi:hypothetical protein